MLSNTSHSSMPPQHTTSQNAIVGNRVCRSGRLARFAAVSFETKSCYEMLNLPILIGPQAVRWKDFDGLGNWFVIKPSRNEEM